MEETQKGEGLGLLRNFSGIVKQEAERGGRNLGGEIPESWSLTVKCLEIHQEVGQEEEGKKVKMESKWSHTILPGRSSYHVALQAVL